ncbi:MAG: serpin family protein [Chloroflexota bacterium]
MTTLTRVPAVVLLAVATVGCSLLSSLQPPAEARSNAARAAADPTAAQEAATAVNGFGFDLYAALRAGQTDANIVFSPSSIALALSMARAGARGTTADQMDTVMRALGADGLANGVNSLDQALNSRSGTYPDRYNSDSYPLTLTIANAPFAQRDERWEQSYLDALAQRFDAGVRLVDYKANFEAARQQINDWVDQQTNARIPELLTPGTLDALTRLVLVNAIYLKAPWLVPFNEDVTTSAPFIRLDGSTVQAQMMAVSDSFAYAQGDGWQAVELPYVGNKLAMTLILPDNFAAYAAALDASSFAQVTNSLVESKGEVDLPRFDFETKADLADLLAGLGMPLAFDPDRADFSGMTTQAKLYITAVIHQANISVDEKGTEAAAATAVVMGDTSAPVEKFQLTLDHPFLFALRDLETGAVLFLGQVVDPSTPAT